MNIELKNVKVEKIQSRKFRPETMSRTFVQISRSETEVRFFVQISRSETEVRFFVQISRSETEVGIFHTKYSNISKT